jgi:small GTP-binding protein
MNKHPKLLNVKMALIGTYNIGKSSLGKRWMTGVYPINLQSTIAAAYLTKDVYIDDKKVKCHVWDTAGAEKYDSLIPIYLRDAQVVIVCFEEFDEKKILKYAELIHSTNENAVIFLALTKYDEFKGNDFDTGRMETFAAEYNFPFFKTSSKTGEGVEELFSYASRIAFLTKEENSPTIEVDEKTVTPQPQGCCILL